MATASAARGSQALGRAGESAWQVVAGFAVVLGCGETTANSVNAHAVGADVRSDAASAAVQADGAQLAAAEAFGEDGGVVGDGAAIDAATVVDAVSPPGADAASPGLVEQCAAKTLQPWSRKSTALGGAVAFHEIHYHPAGKAESPWIELHNPLGIAVDVTGFRIAGAVQYVFPAGTFLAARGFVVVAGDAAQLAKAVGAPVAIGSYAGVLPPTTATLELWNNAGRLLDTITYASTSPWPVIPDGSGATLAKRHGGGVSGRAESWTASAQVGGTPGAANFPQAATTPAVLPWVAKDAVWHYHAGAPPPPAQWAALAFDDAAWPSAPAPFFAGDAAAGSVAATAKVTADNFFALYVGKADGTALHFVGRDAVGDWTSVESFALQAKPGEHAYVAAWEAPNDNGGPQALIGEIAVAGNALLQTAPTSLQWVLGPAGANPGGALTDAAPPTALVQGLIQQANSAGSWKTPQAAADKAAPPWGPVIAGAFSAGTQFVWADTFADVSASNTASTFVLYRFQAPLLPTQGTTKLAGPLPTTYFRTTFQAPADVALLQPWIDALIDDGAVFYLNGQEVFRLRMPPGVVGPLTLASSAVVGAPPPASSLVAAAALVPGKNVLAVEVHQATIADADLVMAAALQASVQPPEPAAAQAGLAFNEVAAGATAGFWLELTNLGAASTDTNGYVVVSSLGGERVLPAHGVGPGQLLLLGAKELGFGALPSARLFLYTPDRQRVLDGIAVASVPQGRSHGDARPWRYPDTATPGGPNVFVTHDNLIIHEILYRGPPLLAANGLITKSPLEWVELYNRGPQPLDVSGFQLVDAVEFTFGPGSVVAPGGYAVVANDVPALYAAYPALAATGTDVVVGGYSGGLADSGENVVVRDACGNEVDAVPYQKDGAWPTLAHGGGSSLELRDPRADNRQGGAWAASDATAAASWLQISYEAVASPSSVGPDGQYQEFVLGLLDAGVALIDDLSVVEDPGGKALELLQDGTFEKPGSSTWRLLGNHRHSAVITEPGNPANHVLRLVATGAAEHQHNHAETTLAAGQAITNGKTYRVKLRARWQGGSPQLNTRLYFNRLAKTHRLPLPAYQGTPGAKNSQGVANAGPTWRDLRHFPPVPQANEPVVVSVHAADSDGIAQVTLWYAIDSGPALSLPMAIQGQGRFAAVVPGGPAGSVVQYYVAGVDAAGVQSTYPASGPASRALWITDDGLASKSGLHNLRIVLTPADAKWLFDPKNLMSNDAIGGTVVDDEHTVYANVGVRLKGSERGRPETVRVGFAVQFAAEQPFRGALPSLMVDRSEGVGFGQREVFFNQAMNRAGTVASRYDDVVKVLTPNVAHTGPAQLQLARFGDLLLDAQFDNGGEGPVFEYELIYYPTTTDDGTKQGNKLPKPDLVVGIPIKDLGSDKEAYRLPFILKSNRWQDDYQGLMAFAKAFGTTGAQFNAVVAGVIDVDQWLRSFAFATLSGAVDNYGVGDAHNGNFYVRPTDKRVLYLPHDLDFYGGSPHSKLIGGADLAKLVATPARLRTYYGHLHDIVATAYNASYLAWWSDHLGKLLPAQDFAGHLKFVAARAEWVMNGAPNAIVKAIPKVAFEVTTNAGAPVTVAAPEAVLDGVGWIDVHDVRVGKPAKALALDWIGQTAWRAPVALACGGNAIELKAFDRHGVAVGAGKIGITRVGVGCP
ncbi:MAG: hypothetical protein EXR79_05295 [Myxococcales bacterium]|nr:hypothetical protein [Myxococcales bacterium]